MFEELNPVALGIVLKAIRTRNLISQADLAEMIGVNRKTVILIESGDRFPSLLYIFKFSEVMKLTIDEIVHFST